MTIAWLGSPVVPFALFWGRVLILKYTTEKGYPYSILPTGGPSWTTTKKLSDVFDHMGKVALGHVGAEGTIDQHPTFA